MTLPPYSSWKLACVTAVTFTSPTSDAALEAFEPGVADCCGVGDCAGDADVVAFWFCAGGGAQASVSNIAEVKTNDATVLMSPLPECVSCCTRPARQVTTKRALIPFRRTFRVYVRAGLFD